MAQSNGKKEEKLDLSSSPSDTSDVNSTAKQGEIASDPVPTNPDGKIEIKEEDNLEKLGLTFPTWKKMDDSHCHLRCPNIHDFQYKRLP